MGKLVPKDKNIKFWVFYSLEKSGRYDGWVVILFRSFFGGHHGKTIILPNKEYGIVQMLKDLIPFIGHAPKEIIDGTAQYFYGRGMKCEAEYVKSFRKVAKI